MYAINIFCKGILYERELKTTLRKIRLIDRQRNEVLKNFYLSMEINLNKSNTYKEDFFTKGNNFIPPEERS